MTSEEAIQAANRAANGVMMLPKHQSWVSSCFGWSIENHRKGLAHCVAFAREQKDAPAEALYIEMRRETCPAWGEAKPLVRAAVEVFVGTLRACDKLVVTAPPAAPSTVGGFLREQDDEMAAGMDERI